MDDTASVTRPLSYTEVNRSRIAGLRIVCRRLRKIFPTSRSFEPSRPVETDTPHALCKFHDWQSLKDLFRLICIPVMNTKRGVCSKSGWNWSIVCGKTLVFADVFLDGGKEAARGAGLIMDKCFRGDGDCDGRKSCLG